MNSRRLMLNMGRTLPTLRQPDTESPANPWGRPELF
jgi:hypothetical protein